MIFCLFSSRLNWCVHKVEKISKKEYFDESNRPMLSILHQYSNKISPNRKTEPNEMLIDKIWFPRVIWFAELVC